MTSPQKPSSSASSSPSPHTKPEVMALFDLADSLVIEGFLWKGKKRNTRVMQRRWFSNSGDLYTLSYFSNDKAAQQQQQQQQQQNTSHQHHNLRHGFIDLREVDALRVTDFVDESWSFGSSSKTSCEFHLFTPERVWVLSARGKESVAYWKTGFQRIMHFVSHPPPPSSDPPPSLLMQQQQQQQQLLVENQNQKQRSQLSHMVTLQRSPSPSQFSTTSITDTSEPPSESVFRLGGTTAVRNNNRNSTASNATEVSSSAYNSRSTTCRYSTSSVSEGYSDDDDDEIDDGRGKIPVVTSENMQKQPSAATSTTPSTTGGQNNPSELNRPNKGQVLFLSDRAPPMSPSGNSPQSPDNLPRVFFDGTPPFPSPNQAIPLNNTSQPQRTSPVTIGTQIPPQNSILQQIPDNGNNPTSDVDNSRLPIPKINKGRMNRMSMMMELLDQFGIPRSPQQYVSPLMSPNSPNSPSPTEQPPKKQNQSSTATATTTALPNQTTNNTNAPQRMRFKAANVVDKSRRQQKIQLGNSRFVSRGPAKEGKHSPRPTSSPRPLMPLLPELPASPPNKPLPLPSNPNNTSQKLPQRSATMIQLPPPPPPPPPHSALSNDTIMEEDPGDPDNPNLPSRKKLISIARQTNAKQQEQQQSTTNIPGSPKRPLPMAPPRKSSAAKHPPPSYLPPSRPTDPSTTPPISSLSVPVNTNISSTAQPTTINNTQTLQITTNQIQQQPPQQTTVQVQVTEQTNRPSSEHFVNSTSFPSPPAANTAEKTTNTQNKPIESQTTTIQSTISEPSTSSAATTTTTTTTTDSLALEQQQDVCLQLVKQEIEYAISLQAVVNCYLVPLRKDKTMFSRIYKADMETLFSNIEVITDLHRRIAAGFTEMIKEARGARGLTPTLVVYRMFNKSDAMRSAYREYVRNYPNAMLTLTKCIKSKRVRNFFKACKESAKGLELGTLLSMPIEKISSYDLAFERIIELQGKNVGENELLMHESLHDLSEYVIDMHSRYQLERVERCFRGLREPLAGKVFLRSGLLSLARTMRVSRGDYFVWLFSDVLYLTKRFMSKYTVVLMLDTSLIVDVATPAQKSKVLTLMLNEELEDMTFQCQTPEECVFWVDAFTYAKRRSHETQLFGIDLTVLMQRRKERLGAIPHFVTEITKRLVPGLEGDLGSKIGEQGVSPVDFAELKALFNRDLPIPWERVTPTLVPEILKYWLRKLPSPIVPFHLYANFVNSPTRESLRDAIMELPIYHRFVLQHLLETFIRMCSGSKVENLVRHLQQIAGSFGPCVLRTRDTTRNPRYSQYNVASNEVSAPQVIVKLAEHYAFVFRDIRQQRQMMEEEQINREGEQQAKAAEVRTALRKQSRAISMIPVHVPPALAAPSQQSKQEDEPTMVPAPEEPDKFEGVALEDVIYQGWMNKQSIKKRIWEQHWFVLIKGGRLFYFHSDHDQKPQGVIDLQGRTINLDGSKPFGICITATTSSRAVFIAPSSESEREDWMKAISSLIPSTIVPLQSSNASSVAPSATT